MRHITGIGGIFFKANNPEELALWYKQHLGLNVEEYGGVTFREGASLGQQPQREAYIVWSPFAADTDYFAPSEKPFMINFRVNNLDSLLVDLRNAGVRVDEKREETEFGRFGWIMDPEGNRVELWEPPLASGTS